jgi:hypothetical protein
LGDIFWRLGDISEKYRPNDLGAIFFQKNRPTPKFTLISSRFGLLLS